MTFRAVPAATIVAIRPDAAEAEDDHDVADPDPAPAHGAVSGRQHVREEDGILVRHLVRDAPQAAVGERNPDQLGLAALEPRVHARVAEQRARLALGAPPGTAVRAAAVRGHARVHHPLARSAAE